MVLFATYLAGVIDWYVERSAVPANVHRAANAAYAGGSDELERSRAR
jgi:hypothetical protein